MKSIILALALVGALGLLVGCSGGLFSAGCGPCNPQPCCEPVYASPCCPAPSEGIGYTGGGQAPAGGGMGGGGMSCGGGKACG